MSVAILAVIAVVGVTVSTPPPQSSAGILHEYAGFDEKEFAAYPLAHPDQLLLVANSHMREIAAEWNRRTAREKARLIAEEPFVVGNLDGLPYSTRDRANRLFLRQSLTHIRRIVAKYPENTDAVELMATLNAVHAAVTKTSIPRRQLIEFFPGIQPTAAVAVGNLDTSTLVTWAVPGMGTYPNDMQLWSQAAQNIWAAQGAEGATKKRAVVAWIGYNTPPAGLSAALGDYATHGAPALTQAIEGFRLARSRELSALTVNVVAHSYGSTMAADALADTDLHIASFVMLGSAGVEDRIQTASRIHAAHVYAGEAQADHEAALGRIDRVDPRAPRFGARVIDVDSNGHDGFRPVTGHEPVLHSAWNDDITSSAWSRIADPGERVLMFDRHEDENGYLDLGTRSLFETAKATTPR